MRGRQGRGWLTVVGLVSLLNYGPVLGAEPSGSGGHLPGETHMGRVVFTSLGGGGGFLLGVFGGIGLFDDSIDASRKITTFTAVAAAGGAVGGYLVGRFLDKRTAKSRAAAPQKLAPDRLDRALLHSAEQIRRENEGRGNSPVPDRGGSDPEFIDWCCAPGERVR